MTNEMLDRLYYKSFYVSIPSISIMTILIWLIYFFDLEVLRPYFYISGTIALVSQIFAFGVSSIRLFGNK